MRIFLTLILCTTLLQVSLFSQKKEDKTKTPDKPAYLQSSTYSGLKFRNIGPAVTSGRISDFAVNPANPAEYYVASSAGGVWKTVNAGTTYTPVFDGEGSYSIGCVTIDPSNVNVVWVGSGENNNQRSVSYGDGVYKSEDGGKSWKNMGLKNSEHIANVLVDPTNSNTVYVAAYGPVWSDGGDRGVYKSTDGGTTWTCVKSVSQYTGCNNLVMDPRDPQVLYAAFHQRQRKVFTYIGGGPESALYKSTDGGATWNKLGGGLPSGDLGRIGIDVSPVNSDYVYAVVEAQDGKGGVYRSTDRGASWSKMSGAYTSGNYYQELTCDPKNADRIFITDTYYQVSDDGGKTLRNLGELNKHIDNHCIWIDPANTDHLRVGCDGGVYESWDFASTWEFKHNLPVTQFYKVSTDNGFPFYHVHGGTQDNLSLGGPSRSTSENGIPNSDWYITSIGDGFETQVDPTNPDIIYAQSQYGGLVRFDRKSGEYLPIKPQEGEDEPALRWNWDAPLTISNHSPTRLYFGANILFRTDDRGSSWRAISPDLSRGLDRNKLEVMGKVWSMDAVAKNGSTDIYGQTTSIAESSLDEDLLWVGTDDGLLWRTRDGGKTWDQFDNLPGVPSQSYVHQVIASQFDKNIAYVCFNHHRYGDFKPYLLKTTDGGNSWTSISSNLPERGSVYTIAEDHVDRNLLFCGTEFGVFFSPDGGQNWVQLKAGLPTIAVRDIEIQRRENDLVLGTFGRSFYILDDYSPLRNLQKETFDKDVAIYPVKDAWMFIPSKPLGLRDKGHLGSSYFLAENPPVGAVFTYWLKEDIKTLQDKRREAEKAMAEKKEAAYYPDAEAMRAEDNQPDPYLLFTITDADGEVVRHIKAPAKKGLKRLVWDFRYNTPAPVTGRFTPAPDQLFGGSELGHLALAGTYNVAVFKYEDGVLSPLAGPVSFQTKSLNNATLPAKDQRDYLDFCKKISALRKAASAANMARVDLNSRLGYIETALREMPAPPQGLLKKTYDIGRQLQAVGRAFSGDASLARRQFETPPSLNSRISEIEDGMWNTTAAPTETFRKNYRIATKQLSNLLTELKALAETIATVEQELELKGAPATPGRWPNWKE
ncbi:MAG: glycosyl hydrolase [Lewinellaceae bacterium]|nr:glycosyl hydrolase [Saprospiraceae bacterium]MCB9331700.1 glycosyl hydrolase [Lewinellaceae bacterium]